MIKPPTVFEEFRGHDIETYNRNGYLTAGAAIDFWYRIATCCGASMATPRR